MVILDVWQRSTCGHIRCVAKEHGHIRCVAKEHMWSY